MAGSKLKNHEAKQDEKPAIVTSGWKQLTANSRSRCPKLFYFFKGDEDGYTLNFTDLIGLWTAEATKDDIYTYAKETRASIDPTAESQGQYHVLLKKLNDSLIGGDNTMYQDAFTDDESIVLGTTLPLHASLRPLKWEFKLAPSGAGEMAENILRPCLHQAAQAKEHVGSLLDVIKHKDLVIEKMFDRLIATGQDPSVIWPNLGNIRIRKGQKMKRTDVGHIVIGLDEFDRKRWFDGRMTDGPYAVFEANGLGTLIAGCEKCPKYSAKDYEKWLSKLPKSTATKSQVAKVNAIRSSSPVRNNSSDSDAFESLRRTEPLPKAITRPPALITAKSSALPSSPPMQPMQVPEIESENTPTASDDSDDEIPMPTKPAARIGRLGGLGGLSRLPSRLEASSPASSPPLRPVNNRSDTLSPEPEMKPPSRLKKESSTTVTPKRSATPKKMGRIGGTRQLTPTREMLVSPSPKKGSRESNMHPPKPKFGKLGSSQVATLSQSQSQVMNGTSSGTIPHKNANADDSVVEKNKHNEEDRYDSASSTASEPSTPSQKVTDKQPALGALNRSSSPSKRKSSSPTRQITPEPKKVLTKAEQAAQKRDELKRKIDAANASGTVRKKRKL